MAKAANNISEKPGGYDMGDKFVPRYGEKGQGKEKQRKG